MATVERAQEPLTVEEAPEEYVEESNFDPVEKLTEMGVSATDVKKLKDAGFFTVQSLSMRPKKDLVAVKGLSEAKVEKIMDAASKINPAGSGSFITGMDVVQKRKSVVKITTGSTSVDDVLGGGVESQSITELYGEFRTGKTQWCHTLCVTTQMPCAQGGGEGKAAYIDTEGTFRPERIKAIAERFNLDAEAVLGNIIWARVYTADALLDCLVSVAAQFSEQPFKLLVVDSLMGPFRVDYQGRGELSERQQKVGALMSRLNKIADEFNVAVIITNQVMADPGGSIFAGADNKKPIGGHVLAHASTTRLYLKKGKGENRICKVVCSPHMPEAEGTYSISDGGIAPEKD